ncbi:15433_t:CDS:2 [Dentiscutata heterogama]|uniref:15433_t:CDS:1 n=1 Tax=Dentiscutata heterogama TaxID=1316150 RepID=A0ACA9K4W1_9GLOM|nr:15433_t:CDS:2 [Dentiscutata heterogama]
MPDSPHEGEELHLPGLQDLILEKYVDYAGYTHNTVDRYIECNDNSLELSAIENMFQTL